MLKKIEYKYNVANKHIRLTISVDRVTIKYPYSEKEVDQGVQEFLLGIAEEYKDTQYTLRGKFCKRKRFKLPFLELHRTENGKTIHVKAYFYKNNIMNKKKPKIKVNEEFVENYGNLFLLGHDVWAKKRVYTVLSEDNKTSKKFNTKEEAENFIYYLTKKECRKF